MSQCADTTDRPDLRCPICGGGDVVRAGRRELVEGERQLWRCHACGKRFSKLERGDKRTPGNVVPLHYARHQRWNWLTTQAAQALRLARHNRERHAVIERYFLSCDRNTVATEVPVWFFDKRLGATVTGHIDVLMANFGKLWVLDYKPRAAKENPAKVASQLALYAQALVYRAGVNRQDIRCAWFDDRDCFAFAP